jgi:hypothetical protein
MILECGIWRAMLRHRRDAALDKNNGGVGSVALQSDIRKKEETSHLISPTCQIRPMRIRIPEAGRSASA